MRRSQFSIEAAIVASAAALFAILGFFLYFIINDNSSRAADEAFDRVLGAAALTIADTVAFDNGAVTVDIPYSAFAILGTSRLNRVFYRIVAPDRSLVTGSPVLALEIPSASGPDLRFADSQYQDEAIRVAAVGRYRSDAVTGEAGWIDVLVAETREARDQLAGQLAVEAAIPAAIIATLAFLLIWIGIRLAFSPLRTVERSLRIRSPADLTPIAGRVPREIDALVISLNEFMSRLDSTLEGLRRVTSDAAHQLRTPLTAIRAQSEIGLEDEDVEQMRRRLGRINANAINAGILANRWLTDATLLHKLKTRHTEPVDFRQQIERAIDRLAAEGVYKSQAESLNVMLPDSPVVVMADPVSLIEMVRNLIENAFLHAPGPTAVALDVVDGAAQLDVIDQGPGIPHENRERVFERFERTNARVEGTGLGLSIAKDVAEAVGGTIALLDGSGRGLTVRVVLPLYAPLSRAGKGRGVKRHARAHLAPVVALICAMLWVAPASEAVAQSALVIASTMAPERFAPISDELARRFPDVDIVYQQARSPEVAARVRARTDDEPDIVILPSPDIAVSLTNDGLAARLNIPGVAPALHWRNELYVIAHDPAVVAFNKQALTTVPQNRLELAQMLEQSPTPLHQRIGIVNVGIDSVSYTLAAQDSLRSPLYWRLARAFGVAQARIHNTSEELLTAIARGDIDIAYNVPLSTIEAHPDVDDIGYLAPQDYVVAIPWVVLVPEARFRPLHREIVSALLDDDFSHVLQHAFGQQVPSAGRTSANIQSPELGPELLVFLDSIKRGTFLDTWFQMVTTP